MKLTEYNYGCNSLTNFEFEAHAKTGNGNRVYIFNLLEKKYEITSFRRVLVIWNHCVT